MKFSTFVSIASSLVGVWAQVASTPAPQFNILPFGGNVTAGTTYSISWTGGDGSVGYLISPYKEATNIISP
jgi:hypothetical protein